jgi:hypothetical protein
MVESVKAGNWWSVPQAIVWIVSGSESSVEDARPHITIASLRELALVPISTGEGAPLSLNDARAQLMRAAGAEKIGISGQRPNGQRELIPASALKVSRLFDLNGLNDCMPCIMEGTKTATHALSIEDLVNLDDAAFKDATEKFLQPTEPRRHWLHLWVRADECRRQWPMPMKAAGLVQNAAIPEVRSTDDDTPSDGVVTASLVLEQARRIKADEPCGKNEVRVYLRQEFPHLSRDDADRFYDALQSNLKPKSGPKGPWKNKPPSP